MARKRRHWDHRPSPGASLRPLANHSGRRARAHRGRLRRPQQAVRGRLDPALASLGRRSALLGARASRQCDQLALAALLHTVRAVRPRQARDVRARASTAATTRG